MSELAVRVEGLGKEYRLGGPQERYTTLRDRLNKLASAPFRALRGCGERSEQNPPFWALKDVSFEVPRGEVVGIIGRNGAGKSTLLKILSRITEPTEGEVDINGRVGSLLEVGTGFHPELTGRENVYLNGAILGMRRAEIARKFDEIVAFAEVEKFIDTPVKHYSSGMYMRLAFAVAAHLEPKILIVDEVLAVGDAAFQKKCMGKMDEVGRGGRTVLFVSHNMQAILNLCNHVMWIDEGKVRQIDIPPHVISTYLHILTTASNLNHERIWVDSATCGNDKARLHSVRLAASGGATLVGPITMDRSFQIEVEYSVMSANTVLHVSICIHTIDGTVAFDSSNFEFPSLELPDWHCQPLPTGRFRSICHIPRNLMNQGNYRLRVILAEDDTKVVDIKEACYFTVHDAVERNLCWFGQYTGVVHPRLEWTTGLVENPPLQKDRQ